MSDNLPLGPHFLGAYAENNDEFESMWLEFYRDHVYWRRSFHPEDTPPIKPSHKFQPEYQDAVGRCKQSLHKLTAKLKQSVPFFHPRYIGHMSSDLLMPGVLAQMITTLYNPNNVSSDAAPVTTELELDCGRQLATMFGFNADKNNPDGAFGHLTSGGSVANYEGLWYARSLKHYPLALRQALAPYTEIELFVDNAALLSLSDWQLFNLDFDQIIQLRQDLFAQLQEVDDGLRQQILQQVKQHRIEHLGPMDFFAQFPGLKQPKVLVPTTAHYSWDKAMKILGLGTRQLAFIPTDRQMRIDADALSQMLEEYQQQQQPVLAVVGVLGTTEFGTIDPIHKMLALRETYSDKGLGFFMHIDAAWGGYLSALFRDHNDQLRDYDSVRNGFNHFPSQDVYQTFAALHQVESITVDPHKLGYLPFGCGAFLCRNKRARGFVMQDAAYVFAGDKYADVEPQLGQYIFEGSKPGAAAAAVATAHDTLPLHHGGIGGLSRRTIACTEYFYDQVDELNRRLQGIAKVVVPIEPDSNLLCLAINPQGNHCLNVMNSFVDKLNLALKIDPAQPLQNKHFFGSSTKIFRRYLCDDAATQLCQRLDLNPKCFSGEEQDCGADHILVLRHTLMNPWLVHGEGNYIDKYIDYLSDLIRDSLQD